MQKIIENAFEQRASLKPSTVHSTVKEAILTAIEGLDSGKYRVAEKQQGKWVVNEWLKKAVLLYFRLKNNTLIEGQFSHFFDKVPLKYENYQATDFEKAGVRIVPPACVRKGAFLAPNTVMMPAYVNIGAYIDSGTLIDTWATVGSCAQIGKNVHLSGGVGIGGVLEPLQANPTIIEDNCFIGARSEVVEGVIVEEGAVLSMGVYIGQSTKIYNRQTGEIIYGRVPAGSVVVPGTLPDQSGDCHLYCAVIVKQVDEKTRSKVSINELLRNVD